MAKRGDKDEDERPDPEEEAPSSSEGAEEDESDSSEEDASEEEDESEEDESEEDESEEDEKAEEEEDEDDADAKDEDEDSNDESEEEPKAAESEDEDESDADAKTAEGEEDDVLPAQLGVQKYVYSAFFSAMVLGGFVVGRAIETIWSRVAITDWAVTNVPAITGIPDETKQTYSFVIAGVIAIGFGIHYFRKESVRKWSEEVSGELLKVKWPTRKEVYSSVVVVLATSAVAVTYLFLLDRFWGFVTDKIYGIGS